MSERDEKLEEVVDNWLAAVVTKKVERYLEDNREEVIELYGTDEPSIDVVRQKLHEEQPSQVVDPIEVALELRDAIQAVERRSFVLPFAMFHIGGLLAYFEVCLRERAVPRSLIAHFRIMVATEDGRKPHEPRLKKIDEVLADPIRIVEDSYAEGDNSTQVELTDWLLGINPKLIDDIVEAMNPKTIRKKKPGEWTADDKKYYARKRLMKEFTRIARKHGKPVYGDPGIRKGKS